MKFDPPIPEIFAKLASQNLSHSPYFPNGHQHIREDVRARSMCDLRSFRARELKTHTFFSAGLHRVNHLSNHQRRKKAKIFEVCEQKTFRTGQKTAVPLKVPWRDFYYLLAGEGG